jgi:CHAT domain-containing protein
VSYEPSAALLLNSLSTTPQRSSRASTVLAIGNPSFEQGALHLQNLPSAAIEANRVASIYRNPTVLVDKEATDAAFAALAPQADVIHFAGHAVVGRDAPQRSHLVLASDGQSAGVLFSTDIAQWHLRHTRLVVLSACSTSDGRLSPTEGASSLARAFFAAGVPAVVSSLWPVDDADATADFFRAFHKSFERGESAAQALQDAQIRALTEGGRSRPARSWAAFQVFGRS